MVEYPEVKHTTTPAPVVSVIILNYNTRELTLKCLRTLYETLGDVSAEVWLVDNASSDNSVTAIREAFPQVRLIANEKNVGFGAGNNQAMRQASGEFLLLLNSDAFPEPGAVQALIAYLRANPKAAAVGPRLLNKDGSLQASCYRFPSPARAWLENLWVSAALPNHPKLGDYRRWPHDRERVVDFVIGACMLVRREAYEKVGGFDEQFFMYSEEIDWQRRMKLAGWQVAFTPTAKVTHLGGASGAAEQARINRYFFGSLDYYELKHHGRLGLVLLRLAMVIGCSLRAVMWLPFIAAPRRRTLALAKVRLHGWLVLRQLTHWRFSTGPVAGRAT